MSINDHFDELVRDNRGLLRNYVARRVPPQDVDDVVSEVLAAAWRHRDADPEQPRLWLLRTASNLVLHQYRTQRRQQRLRLRLAAHSTRPTGADHSASDSEAAEVVRTCLARLSSRDQEIVRLVYWDGLGLDDAAFVVGTTPAAARVRLHRARTRLAALLPAWLDQPDGAKNPVTPPASPTASTAPSLREAHS